MKTERNTIVSFLFWANFGVFALHIMDEALMGGGFVPFIQRHFWAGFAWADFFTANTIWLILIGSSNILYDMLGKRFAVFPMAFLWERVFNALFHIVTTVWFREYSPGLMTGVLFFVVLYLIVRYGVIRGHIRRRAFILGGIAAAVFETLFISSMGWAH